MTQRQKGLQGMVENLHRWRQSITAPFRHDLAMHVLAAMLAIAGLAGLVLLLGRAPGTARAMTSAASLDSIGLEGVSLDITYPVRLTPADDELHPETITVRARSTGVEPAPEFDVWLDVSDGAFFVDPRGQHINGRVTSVSLMRSAIVDLRIAHAGVASSPHSGAPRVTTVQVSATTSHGSLQLSAQGFDIILVTPGEYARRQAARAVAISTATLVLIIASAYWLTLVVDGARLRRVRREEARLAALYDSLREHVSSANWADARRYLNEIRRTAPGYRDVEDLGRTIDEAEMIARRREQWYSAGVRAYRDRDWATAARAFSALEAEDRFANDVGYLRRTSELYLGLTSRDRSVRAAAARQLGEVGDLVDFAPLLAALGDSSEQVADAAADAFRAIGFAAPGALVEGLAHDSPAVRQRSYGLLEECGQSAKPHLLAALRSANPHLSAPAAALLGRLGARQELADALLYVTPEQRDGVIAALVREGPASCGALVQTLLGAEPARQQAVLEGIAALRAHCDVDRYLEDMLRRTKDPAQRDVIDRALKAPIPLTEPSSSGAETGDWGAATNQTAPVIVEPARAVNRVFRLR